LALSVDIIFFATRENLNLAVENPIIIASKGQAFGSHFSQTGLVSDFGVVEHWALAESVPLSLSRFNAISKV